MAQAVEKTCARCRQVRLHNTRSDGRPKTYCITCTKAYSKAHYEANKATYNARRYEHQKRYRQEARELLKELKSVPCADCGQTYPPCVMDFDHLDGSTKVDNVGDIATQGSLNKLLVEIDKCEVVCANCHRIRTWIVRPEQCGVEQFGSSPGS